MALNRAGGHRLGEDHPYPIEDKQEREQDRDSN